MVAALESGIPLPESMLPSAASRSMQARRVPPWATRPAWMTHPRMRRTSPISQFAVSAALEALGPDATPAMRGERRLGVICAVMSGSVAYSRRFYAEVLENPATASPMLFPETVFNAPSSHVAAILESPGPNVTLVSDQTGFFSALEMAVDWLGAGDVDGCLVLAAEEADWITAEAHALFARGAVTAEGAAAIYLRREPSSVVLSTLTGTVPYRRGRSTAAAVRMVLARLPSNGQAGRLFEASAARRGPGRSDGLGVAWTGRRVSCPPVLGEGLAASGGWGCVAAARAVGAGLDEATAGVAGSNLGVAAARFSRPKSG